MRAIPLRLRRKRAGYAEAGVYRVCQGGESDHDVQIVLAASANPGLIEYTLKAGKPLRN